MIRVVWLLGAGLGLDLTFAVLTATGLAGLLAAFRLWPTEDDAPLPHRHDDLPAGHPHLAEHAGSHAHDIVIDDLHRVWPRKP